MTYLSEQIKSNQFIWLILIWNPKLRTLVKWTINLFYFAGNKRYWQYTELLVWKINILNSSELNAVHFFFFTWDLLRFLPHALNFLEFKLYFNSQILSTNLKFQGRFIINKPILDILNAIVYLKLRLIWYIDATESIVYANATKSSITNEHFKSLLSD